MVAGRPAKSFDTKLCITNFTKSHDHLKNIGVPGTKQLVLAPSTRFFSIFIDLPMNGLVVLMLRIRSSFERSLFVALLLTLARVPVDENVH